MFAVIMLTFLEVRSLTPMRASLPAAVWAGLCRQQVLAVGQVTVPVAAPVVTAAGAWWQEVLTLRLMRAVNELPRRLTVPREGPHSQFRIHYDSNAKPPFKHAK